MWSELRGTKWEVRSTTSAKYEVRSTNMKSEVRGTKFKVGSTTHQLESIRYEEWSMRYEIRSMSMPEWCWLLLTNITTIITFFFFASFFFLQSTFRFVDNYSGGLYITNLGRRAFGSLFTYSSNPVGVLCCRRLQWGLFSLYNFIAFFSSFLNAFKQSILRCLRYSCFMVRFILSV